MRVGDCISFRPRSVARTRLIGLREPVALASTSLTPTAARTARIAPPAITSVPSDPGCLYTCAAPWPDLTAFPRLPMLCSSLDKTLSAYSTDLWNHNCYSRVFAYKLHGR